MAEDEGFMDAGEQLSNGDDTMPQVGMISQYVKDLSFENPNAPAVYQWQSQPQIDVQFNIGANMLADEIHEVALKIEIAARAEDQAVSWNRGGKARKWSERPEARGQIARLATRAQARRRVHRRTEARG